ncbi:Uncharacterized protein TCM_006250 [Theobroma cacao]|uniref:Uncharacterized protein n=1 Tax=Theobroma cacao TaxID=3641 RepID=A0A061DYP8_THECC|nr:Uncharacterized protein TCM_006250 [Theobroma cacao]
MQICSWAAQLSIWAPSLLIRWQLILVKKSKLPSYALSKAKHVDTFTITLDQFDRLLERDQSYPNQYHNDLFY